MLTLIMSLVVAVVLIGSGMYVFWIMLGMDDATPKAPTLEAERELRAIHISPRPLALLPTPADVIDADFRVIEDGEQ